ncbi:MAG: hypothetical protein RIS43_426, partial [Actinomycetota bacterium]
TGALTAASNTALTNLANDIKMFQITSIELSASSSSTLRAGRLTKVLDVLKRVGITTIPTKTHKLSPKLAASNASILIKYVG